MPYRSLDRAVHIQKVFESIVVGDRIELLAGRKNVRKKPHARLTAAHARCNGIVGFDSFGIQAALLGRREEPTVGRANIKYATAFCQSVDKETVRNNSKVVSAQFRQTHFPPLLIQ